MANWVLCSFAQLANNEADSNIAPRAARRADDERPPEVKPTQADSADARALSLEPRVLRTKFGGLFLFLRRWSTWVLTA